MTKLQALYQRYFINKYLLPLNKKKYLQAATFLSLTLGACHTPKQSAEQQQASPFTLINAYSQNWTAGQKDGGRGTDYYFKIKLTTADPVTFDSMWVNQAALPVFLARESNTVSSKPITFTKGDTIILRGTSTQATAKSQPPVPSTGAALVRYTVNGQSNYYTIEQMEKKESLNLPTKN